MEKVKIKLSFFSPSVETSGFKCKEISDTLKRKFWTVFGRAATFSVGRRRRQEKSGIFANLADAMDLMFKQWGKKRLFHVPSVAKQQGFSGIDSVFIGDEDEIASDFEFRPVAVFVHEMHPDRNSGVFVLVLGNGEERNKELRQREIWPVGFVRVVEVKVSGRSFL